MLADRRGSPPPFVASNRTSPLKPQRSAISVHEFANADLPARREVDELGARKPLTGKRQPLRDIIDVQEIAASGLPSPHTTSSALTVEDTS